MSLEVSSATRADLSPAAPVRSASQLFASTDWSQTALGAVEHWPPSLRYQWSWMSTSPQPAILYWGEHRICIYNDAFAIAVGEHYHPGLFGMPAATGWGAMWPQVSAEIDSIMSGEPALHQSNRRISLLRAGVLHDTYWTYALSPIRALDGKAVLGVLATCTETTAEVEAARKSWETEERYQFAIEASGNIGWWDWDIVNNRLYANPQFASSFGVDPACAANGLPLSAFTRGIHELDRERVQRGIERAVADADVFNDEYRIVDEAGTERWIVARGRCFVDGAGRPIRFPGTAIDITARKRVETELARKEEFLQLAQAAAGVGSFEWKLSNDRVYGSPMFNQLWGLPHGGAYDEGVPATMFSALVHPDDVDELPNSLSRPLEQAVQKGQYRVPTASGIRWLSHQGELRLDEFNRPDRVVGAIFDITERQNSLSRQDALLDEMSSRVNDAFIFLQDVISRSLRTAPTLADAQAALKLRLGALAMAQRALSAGKWAHADLRALIGMQFGDYPPAFAQRIAISGPAASLCSDSTLFMSLALYELTSNALKYGALTAEHGRVEIAWKIEMVQRRPTALTLQWKELGGPYVTEPTRRGFGIQLLECGPVNVASTSTVEFDPRGLRFTLRLPIDLSALAR